MGKRLHPGNLNWKLYLKVLGKEGNLFSKYSLFTYV